jgi:hypothetical protein
MLPPACLDSGFGDRGSEIGQIKPQFCSSKLASLCMIQFFHSLWTWLDVHSGAFALIVTLATSLFLALKYLNQRSVEIRDRRFEVYHTLIQRLVEPAPGTVMKLERQVAVVYELRNFPEYYDVTFRILRGLREAWKSVHGIERLLSEIDLTLAYLEMRTK